MATTNWYFYTTSEGINDLILTKIIRMIRSLYKMIDVDLLEFASFRFVISS